MVTMKYPLTLGSTQQRTATVLMITAAAVFALSGCAPTSVGGAAGGPNPVGNWGTMDTTGEPFLSFAEGGQLSGSDGCNNLAGGWELDGNTIDFENVASTLMACEGVNTWLSGLDEATISGTTMTIIDDTDTVIGTLERAE